MLRSQRPDDGGSPFLLGDVRLDVLTRLGWLGLEVATIDRAHAFYGETLSLDLSEERPHERRYQVGGSQLRVRTPDAGQPAGAHVHYAFGTGYYAYDGWYDHLDVQVDLEEYSFGTYTSPYLDDPDGHCVEIGQQHVDTSVLGEIFEIVLEVDDLGRAEEWYLNVGFDLSGRGDDRPRVRLDAEPLELELWEPHHGLAGARGGEHIDLGFEVAAVGQLVPELEGEVRSVELINDGYRIVDPDGHHVTLFERFTVE